VGSDAGAEELARAGAKVFRGDVNDLEALRGAAGAADGIVHTAFNHDPSDLKQHSENDRKVIATLGAAVVGTGRPLIITSGTDLVQSKGGQPVMETDNHPTSAVIPRAASEETAEALVSKGGNVMVMRRFRLALETGEAGARYHAVAEEGVLLREIAEVIGDGLGLPVESITSEQAPGYYGWLASLAALDLPASGALTQQQLGWVPTGPGLLTDLRETDYDAI
jgi:hypothetical protein